MIDDERSARAHEDRAMLARYLDLLNQAIAQAQARFPYHVVLTSLRQQVGDCMIHVTLVDTHGPCSVLTCRFEGTRLVPTMGHDDRAGESQIRWTLSRSHLYDVITRPWHYLVDPQRFELPPFSVCSASDTRMTATEGSGTSDRPAA